MHLRLTGLSLAPYAHWTTRIGDVPVRVQRASEVRGPGVVVHAPVFGAAAVWDALRAAGARSCGMEALEGRRVEVGVPRIGLDMDGSTLVLDMLPNDAQAMVLASSDATQLWLGLLPPNKDGTPATGYKVPATFGVPFAKVTGVGAP